MVVAVAVAFWIGLLGGSWAGWQSHKSMMRSQRWTLLNHIDTVAFWIGMVCAVLTLALLVVTGLAVWVFR